MKRLYLGIIASMIIMSSIGYYVSYKMFYTKKDNEYEVANEELVNTSKTNSDKIDGNTEILIEHHYESKNKTTYENVTTIGTIVGMNREDMLKYVEDYMHIATEYELEEGLYKVSLITFSKDKVVIGHY